MPVVIILFLIFLVLIAHIANLKLRNRQLERKVQKDFPPASDQEDDD